MDTETQAIAEQRAAEDRAMLEELRQKFEAVEDPLDNELAMAEALAAPPRKMNRAERRQMVRLYAMTLSREEHSAPAVNATIVPRSKRRQRKHHLA